MKKADSIKKRGQKLIKRFSKTSFKVTRDSKEHIRENIFERFSHIQNIRLLILEWSLLVLALITLGAAQAFWFDDSYTVDTFVNGGTYIEATVGRVNSMNPLFATTSSEKTLSRLMFATLITHDYSGHISMGLAQYLHPTDDGKVWTMRLRDNIYWSDGEPITNADVLFTLNLIQNPAVTSIYDSNLENVNISENVAGEIVFTLRAPYADFASALEIPIVPKHELEDTPVKTLIEDSFSNLPVVSGAFSYNAAQTSSKSDETVVYLSANPYYYKTRARLNSFGVHAYTDKTEVINALNGGAVTATAELTAADSDKVSSGTFVARNTPVDAGVFAFFNTSSGRLRDVELRRALQSGIDMGAVREKAPGTEPLNYPLLRSQISLDTMPSLPAYNFDAAAAKVAELKGEGELSLNITTVNSGYLPAVAEAIRTELEKLGIIATVALYEENQDFLANIVQNRAYDILIYEIQLGADPDLLPYYHSSQAPGGGLNLSSYRNALVDDLLIGARETLDTTLRAKKYETFLSYWVEDAPALGLYQANATYYYNKNVQSFSKDVRLVTAMDRFVDVTDWAVNKGSKNTTP